MKGASSLGRKNTVAWKTIHSLCAMDRIDEKQLYAKAKLVLGVYRKVCWSTLCDAEDMTEEAYYFCSSDLDKALIYLEEFAPEKEKEQFENRVKKLFETRWMIELVDSAMLKVYEFPENGKLYHEIISKCFLAKFRYTETELLELLRLERSRYYDRKKEAIMVFGLSLWTISIPALKCYLKDVEYNELEDFEYE